MGKEKAEIIEELKRFKNKIKRKYDVEKIIFFGSRVGEKAKRWSDIDLILVSKKFYGKSFLKRPIGLHFYWSLEYPVDFICYTPREFKSLRKGITIVSQALKEGIEI